MKPTKSQFELMNPYGLVQAAQSVDSLADQLSTDVSEVESAQRTVEENLTGKAGDAERESVAPKIADLHRELESLTKIRTSLDNAANGLMTATNNLKSIVEAVEQIGCKVGDDWSLTPPAGTRPTGANVSEFQDLKKNLDEMVKEWDEADKNAGDALKKTVEDITGKHEEPAPKPDPKPVPPPKQPDPKPGPEGPQDGGDNHVHSPADEQRPNATDVNDPGVKWQDGFNVDEWKQSWKNPQLSDNPPVLDDKKNPIPGQFQHFENQADRDAAWKEYLATIKPGGPRGFLPNPDAVSDRGLKTIGYAGQQLGVSYAWAGHDPKGPSQGDYAYNKDGSINKGDGSWVYDDKHRQGFDCSGLAQYATYQATDGQVTIGTWTGAQLDGGHIHRIGAGDPPQPGDLVYYGSGDAHHVGIYVAPGVIINAPESGKPVELDASATEQSGESVRVERMN